MANIPSEYQYIKNINNIICNGYGQFKKLENNTNYIDNFSYESIVKTNTILNSSFCAGGSDTIMHVVGSELNYNRLYKLDSFINIYVKSGNNSINVTYSSLTNTLFTDCFTCITYPSSTATYNNSTQIYFYMIKDGLGRVNARIQNTTNSYSFSPTTSFNDLSSALAYIYQHFAYVNLYVDDELWVKASAYANGGGATHIAKVTGQLSSLSSNLSDILLVSGGGGGGLLVGETATQGQNAGGISGSGTNSGNQSTGYAFGQGEGGTNVSGGGAGLYGGNKGSSSISGGAGSGYIGNSLVSNKKMVGYNVPTSSDASTKTESVNTFSSKGIANTPKSGNGKAKIKFISDIPYPVEYDQYIRRMNEEDDGYGFFWKNYPKSMDRWTNTDFTTLVNNGYLCTFQGTDWKDYSWFCKSTYSAASRWDWIPFTPNGQEVESDIMPYASWGITTPALGILTLNIVNNGENYTGTISNINYKRDGTYNFIHPYGELDWQSHNKLNAGIATNNGVTAYHFNESYPSFTNGTATYTGTLTQVFNWFKNRFRNIKVYVDGVCWADPTAA